MTNNNTKVSLNSYKIICENGDYWTTSFNGSLEDAKKYFLNTYKVYENFETGEENKTLINQVIDLKLRKDLMTCVNSEGYFLGLKYDELDLFMSLHDINNDMFINWQETKKDILEKLESYVILILGYKKTGVIKV